MNQLQVFEEVLAAEKRIRPEIPQTPLVYSPALSRKSGVDLFFKLENQQKTGSFKVRGVMNKLKSLSPECLKKGIVIASTGNHGAAAGYGLKKTGGKGIVFVPRNAASLKIKAMERFGLSVRKIGEDCSETESIARRYALENQMVYFSPYNDSRIIGGQGTIAMELDLQMDPIDAVFVSVGGGGLISGIAGYFKTVAPGIRIIGCSPEKSQVMVQSVRAGKIVNIPSFPTLSDGTAGGIEPDAITFPLCKHLVDEFVTVSEDEIMFAIRAFVKHHDMAIEGAAGVALAGALKKIPFFSGKKVAIVICGGNIDPERLNEILLSGPCSEHGEVSGASACCT